MKLYIQTDEYYPFHTLDDPSNDRYIGDYQTEIELTDEQYSDYISVMNKFGDWQEKLNYMDKASNRTWKEAKIEYQ